MTDTLIVDTRHFSPVRVTEERLEALLRTAAPSVFPGFDYFEFKPAIRCGDSTRHPDGVLLSAGTNQWWVVEVETHLHDATQHIEAQMRDLVGGFYGPDAFGYLNRHESFKAQRYSVDTYEPGFLLVIDTVTHEIRDVVSRLGLQVVECAVFRAADANQFALAVSGQRPQADLVDLAPGILLALEERDGMALLTPADGKRMPRLKTLDVTIGDAAFECFETSDGAGIVIPLTVEELTAATAATDRYKLITNTAKLVPMSVTGKVITIDSRGL